MEGVYIGPNGDLTARPLQNLRESIFSEPDARHVVVISVGLSAWGAGLINCEKIVNSVKGMGAQPILIFQYRPESTDQVYSNLEKIGCLFAVIHSLLIATTLIAGRALLQQKIGMVAGGALMLISAVFLYFSTRIIPLKVTRGVISGQRPRHDDDGDIDGENIPVPSQRPQSKSIQISLKSKKKTRLILS